MALVWRDVKWGCAGDHGRGAVSCDHRLVLQRPQ